MSSSPVGASLGGGGVPEDESSVDPMDDYEAKGHLSTLMEAHGILNHPDKMKRVHALAGRHTAALKSIKSVKDLKNLYDQKYGSKMTPAQESGPVQKNSLAKPGVSATTGDGDDGN